MKLLNSSYFRLRLLIVLSVLALLLTGLTMWEKYNRKQLVSSFETMYADRLIPASEMFHLSNLLYERGRLMEEFRQHGNPGLTREALGENTATMDSILRAYEKTFLVKEETEHLPAYKSTLSEYLNIEHQMLNTGEGDYSRLNNALDKVHHKLLVLGDIQVSVGKQLAKGHKLVSGNMLLMDTLQTGLLLTLAILIIVLIRDYRASVPRIHQGKVRMN